MSIPREKLHRAFVALMAREGQAIERIERPAAADRRGPKPALFALPNGKTIRLRTNNKPAVMTKAENGAVNAPMRFESEDYLGAIFPPSGPTRWLVIWCLRVLPRLSTGTFTRDGWPPIPTTAAIMTRG